MKLFNSPYWQWQISNELKFFYYFLNISITFHIKSSCNKYFSSFLGFGATQETNDLDLDDVKNKLSNHIPELGSFNESSLPSPEQVEESLKEKCKKNGADPTIIDNLKVIL